jgi:ribosomal protein L17
MKGGDRLRPLGPGQMIRRINDREHIPFIGMLAELVNQGPVADTEAKLKELQERIEALEALKNANVSKRTVHNLYRSNND